ncbi:putative RNA-binding protein [Oxobacter pfennigii]|uniref:Putative RNA-binding protein n=1 Tax=Oxobacter pfennigii TaxID=36849 RepID=A0A0P8WTS4_9CLOT|nr:CooT family nickel-binding protein [Oxobacter pfennigii]KPU46060.1 putative RNA-binding protein [Oxobacter pfennigii]
MCEASAYLRNGDKDELLLQDVNKITPDGDILIIEDIFGDRKMVKGKIKEIILLDHKIIIEKN